MNATARFRLKIAGLIAAFVLLLVLPPFLPSYWLTILMQMLIFGILAMRTLFKSGPRFYAKELKDFRQRTKTGKSALKQICTDKCRKPEPVKAVNLR